MGAFVRRAVFGETRLTAYVLVFFPDYSTSASYLFSTMPH